MSRILLISMMLLGIAFFGCGDQAEEGAAGEVMEEGNGEAVEEGDGEAIEEGDGEDAADLSDEEGQQERRVAPMGDFDLSTPAMAVGQWIEFGADDMPQTLRISVVGSEVNQGTDCYWVQLSVDDFVGQLLVDPEGIELAMAGYEEQFGDFAADPVSYIRDNMSDAEGMASLMGSGESMETALAFVRAIRMVKFEEQGTVMAVDLAGVADWLEGMMQDPTFQEQFQQGFTQGFDAEGGQEGLDTIMEELENVDFAFSQTDVDVAGQRVGGMELNVQHPDGSLRAVISSELPLVPLAYAEASGDGETHFIEVRGFGFSGAQDLLPGAPAQTIQAMMFLQGMEQQMGSMNQ